MNPEIGIIDTIIKTLGTPGLILVCMGAPSLVMAFMYADHRRYDREKMAALKAEALKQERDTKDRTEAAALHKEEKAEAAARFRDEKDRMEKQFTTILAQQEKQFTAIIAQQEKRFEAVVKNYENNVILVENYQRLANELAGIIHMSTQVMTKLVEKIDNNMFCPMIKEGVRK